jgi:hypothetical protein
MNVPAKFGFLLDELRSAGVTAYADLATTLNRQGIRPGRRRWNAHDLYLLMRRHRRTHPAAAATVGPYSIPAALRKRGASSDDCSAEG